MSALPTLIVARDWTASHAQLDDIRFPGESARAVVSGSAGSGKSTLLRSLARMLADEGVETVMSRAATDIPATPPSTVLLVDDAHQLDVDRLRVLADRADDPDAGLIVAARTWPAPAELAPVLFRLERSHPAILLGEVTRPQLRSERPDLGDCEDAVLHLTGGIAWLVHECVGAHDDTDCADDPEHRTLHESLRPRILHRLMSVSPDLRRLVDDLSLGLAPLANADGRGEDLESLLSEGYAEGLLTGDGRPAPVVAESVRAVAPVTRVIDAIQSPGSSALRDEVVLRSFDGITDARASAALAARARAVLPGDAALAAALLEQSVACGADPAAMVRERAQAAWMLGRLDEAGVLLDTHAASAPADSSGELADLAAALWADRGMVRLADETYRARIPRDDPASATRARVAAAGAGRTPAPQAVAPGSPMPTPPSLLLTAYELLDRGLVATLSATTPISALSDLQRASELYTASADSGPSVELPAVIAAAAAIGLGDLKSAQTIVDDALTGAQGGSHREPRLELWSAWISLQRERPVEARAALARATHGRALSPRDDAFAATIEIGLARRYDDAAGLAAVWEASHARITRVEPDLYSLLPLGELVIAAARVGAPEAMEASFEAGLSLVAALGEPPAWSTSLHWAGIQRGILLNRPKALIPHARAMVSAASHNRLAARMAQAGRVWTSVLAGTVDPDAVENAARGLATVGLAWDGARLAGHGAGRSDDRKVIARLLACARELHPRDSLRPADGGEHAEAPDSAGDSPLSEREREVAELVLQGKTYAEIGEAIFISPRTAEHHIAHIRRRLDATSRSDLLAKLRIALDVAAPPTRAAPEESLP
ncbi:LuxR C-terminal-related transcriptional regulator [Microbacterium kyungheense]|uniref:DNA-binding CsgD family transcriptional regulator n=1 Tax=Microbacterium kyungheense TaxID=1263636 RepID=A0A543FJT6_9MICO|nr:LuxR C-terminal-related transcriptional regulator [Microbacterium kyungheense]TQM34140.1 DNA-binding CsgD family transcriptional regulator [Microbacterium kyungheense]